MRNLHPACSPRGAMLLLSFLCSLTLSAETTGTIPLRKGKEVVLFADPRFHSAFPSIVTLPNDELLCAFRRAPSRKHLWGARHDLHTDANSYLVSVRSKDGGETWTSPPQLLYAHAFGGSQDPCLLHLRSGEILCTSYGWVPLPAQALASMPDVPSTAGFGFLGGYLLRSADGGHSWQGPEYPPALPGEIGRSALGELLPAYNRGALLERENGEILWAVVRRESGETSRTAVHLIRSRDKGRNWDYVSPIAGDPKFSFNETSLVETSGGRIAAFIRSEGRRGHAFLALSDDGGKTFSPPEDLGWAGFPQQAIRLSDSRVLLVYGYRNRPYGIRARLLAPDLSDAKTAPELVLRDDGATIDLGYPWAVELPDKRILVVYYINVGGAPPHIAATYLERGN